MKVKHWQVFLLLIIVPMVLQIIVFAVSIIAGKVPSGPVMALIVLLAVPFWLWFYAMGLNLHQRLPSSVPMNLRLFQFSVIYPIIYSGAVFGIFSNIMSMARAGRGNELSVIPAIWMLAILPLHLLAMGCMFYFIYFVAKALKTVENQKPVTISEYAGDIFLLIYFPIGIWLIQPRVNRIFASPDTDFAPAI